MQFTPQQQTWLQQQYGYAMSCLQTAFQFESMGNLQGAGPYYHQASQALTACLQTSGPYTPDPVHYWLGCCSVRLGLLTHASGNPVWGQQWLQQAYANFQAAWQKNPANPMYQAAFAQIAVALGDVASAQMVCQQAGANLQMTPMTHMQQPPQGMPPAGPQTQPATQGSGLAGQVKGWLEAGGKAVDILKSLGLFGGGGGGGGGMPGMGGDTSGMSGNPWGW